MIETITKSSYQPREAVINFIDVMRRRNLVIEEEGGALFFVRVNDKTLTEIKNNSFLLRGPAYMERLILSEGDNIHIIGLFLNRKFDMFQGVRMIIDREKPKSISWWNKNTTKFIYRRILCHKHGLSPQL